MSQSHPPIVHFNQIEPVECPCGHARRAFTDLNGSVASIHKVDISIDAQTHYHKKATEIYVILEAEPDAQIELDGERYPVEPMTTIYIRPGCRHRAVGKMKIINVSIPVFDPKDEWFD